MPRDCPSCGLVCPDTAMACDCGYRLAEATPAAPIRRNTTARQVLLIGGLGCLPVLMLTFLVVTFRSLAVLLVVAFGVAFGLAFGSLGFYLRYRHDKRAIIQDIQR